MKNNLFKVRTLCESTTNRLEELLEEIKCCKLLGIEPKGVDLSVLPDLVKIRREFDFLHWQLSKIEPEPWYIEDLTLISESLEYCEHTLIEEIKGLHNCEWNWELSIDKWIEKLSIVLVQLPTENMSPNE
ncbi:MAG: hypothetical protein U5O15_08305 [Candidatus Krumholzibacteriota bacterium]|nr:hypothetical protein [Candidatus Krumholzibacteriota bacterium]